MTFDRSDVGNLEILALMDGDRELGSITEEAFPDAPAEALMAYRDRYPGVYGEHDGWQLRIRAWLIRHPGGVILVDTGIGQAGAPGVEWFGAAGRLHDVLHETGTPPDAIDTVVISHVHDDHRERRLSFRCRTAGRVHPEVRAGRVRDRDPRGHSRERRIHGHGEHRDESGDRGRERHGERPIPGGGRDVQSGGHTL